MKAVLISIQPKWVKKIVEGKKTIEVRKTCPKLKTPFKCYIYMTKAKPYWFEFVGGGKMRARNGMVIGEFVCDRIEDFSKWEFDYASLLRHINLFAGTNGDYKFLDDYLKGQKKAYGWHITDLKIYDKPKELKEFWTTGHCFNHANTEIVENIMGEYVEQCWKNSFCKTCRHLDDFGGCGKRGKQLTRPPQSWCYVEEQ